MPIKKLMPEGALAARERVYETPAGQHIKNRIDEIETDDPNVKCLKITGQVVEEDGTPVTLEDGSEIIAPSVGLSVNLPALVQKALVLVIEAETEPTELPNTQSPLREGYVWLIPSTGVAQVFFSGSWHNLGTYDAANEQSLVALQIDAVKESLHLNMALKTENYLMAQNYDWGS